MSLTKSYAPKLDYLKASLMVLKHNNHMKRTIRNFTNKILMWFEHQYMKNLLFDSLMITRAPLRKYQCQSIFQIVKVYTLPKVIFEWLSSSKKSLIGDFGQLSGLLSTVWIAMCILYINIKQISNEWTNEKNEEFAYFLEINFESYNPWWTF